MIPSADEIERRFAAAGLIPPKCERCKKELTAEDRTVSPVGVEDVWLHYECAMQVPGARMEDS